MKKTVIKVNTKAVPDPTADNKNDIKTLTDDEFYYIARVFELKQIIKSILDLDEIHIAFDEEKKALTTSELDLAESYIEYGKIIENLEYCVINDIIDERECEDCEDWDDDCEGDCEKCDHKDTCEECDDEDDEEDDDECKTCDCDDTCEYEDDCTVDIDSDDVEKMLTDFVELITILKDTFDDSNIKKTKVKHEIGRVNMDDDAFYHMKEILDGYEFTCD